MPPASTYTDYLASGRLQRRTSVLVTASSGAYGAISESARCTEASHVSTALTGRSADCADHIFVIQVCRRAR